MRFRSARGLVVAATLVAFSSTLGTSSGGVAPNYLYIPYFADHVSVRAGLGVISAQPLTTIEGSHTHLNQPVSVATARDSGKLYVLNGGSSPTTASITVYSGAPYLSGNASPAATISRANTGLGAFSYYLAVSATGKIYVAYNDTPGKVMVYAAGANGNVAPIAAITGPNTGLVQPGAIGVDAAGRIYVANGGPTFNVEVFAAGANGNAHPIATIRGPNTGLGSANKGGLAVTPAGRVYVTNGNGVSIFAAGANGNVAPLARIAGSNTTFDAVSYHHPQGKNTPDSLAFDRSGGFYVRTEIERVVVFAAGATGNATPRTTFRVPEYESWGLAAW